MDALSQSGSRQIAMVVRTWQVSAIGVFMTIMVMLMMAILQSARNIDHRLTVVETKLTGPSVEIVRLQVWFAEMDRAMTNYHSDYHSPRRRD